MRFRHFSAPALIVLLTAFAPPAGAQRGAAPGADTPSAYFENKGEYGLDPIKWDDCLKQKPAWYAGGEAIRIADNVLLYQRESGGWPKNIDMAVVLSERAKAEIAKEKGHDDSLIDNGATY